jgi:hypothetical protein
MRWLAPSHRRRDEESMATLTSSRLIEIPLPPRGMAALLAEFHGQAGPFRAAVEQLDSTHAVVEFRTPLAAMHRITYGWEPGELDTALLRMDHQYTLPDTLDAFRLSEGAEYLGRAADALVRGVARQAILALSEPVSAHVDIECELAINHTLAGPLLSVALEAEFDPETGVLESRGERGLRTRMEIAQGGRGTVINAHVERTVLIRTDQGQARLEAEVRLRHQVLELLAQLAPVVTARTPENCVAATAEAPERTPAAPRERAVAPSEWLGGLA